MKSEISFWGQKPHRSPQPWRNERVGLLSGGWSLSSLLLQRAFNVLTLPHLFFFFLASKCLLPVEHLPVSLCLRKSLLMSSNRLEINRQRSCVKTRSFQIPASIFRQKPPCQDRKTTVLKHIQSLFYYYFLHNTHFDTSRWPVRTHRSYFPRQSVLVWGNALVIPPPARASCPALCVCVCVVCLFKFTPEAILLTTGEFQAAGRAESRTDDSGA